MQEEINQLVTRGQQQQTYQQQAYVQPQVQAIRVAAVQPQVQTIRVAAVQPAAQTVALVAQPSYTTGYQTGGYTTGLSGLSGLTGYSGLSGLSGLTLGGGSTGYTSSDYSTDNY